MALLEADTYVIPPWSLLRHLLPLLLSENDSLLPRDEYVAEQFIIEKAETIRSVASVETVVASINHFCARSKLTLPFLSPAFGLILPGIRHDCGHLAGSSSALQVKVYPSIFGFGCGRQALLHWALCCKHGPTHVYCACARQSNIARRRPFV
jgi:hypothetical protein